MNFAKSIKWRVTFFDWDKSTLRQAFRDTAFYDQVIDSMSQLYDEDPERCQGSANVETSQELSRVLQIAYSATYRGDVVVSAVVEFSSVKVDLNLTSGDDGYETSSAAMLIGNDKNDTNRRTFELVTAIEANLAELRNLAIRT